MSRTDLNYGGQGYHPNLVLPLIALLLFYLCFIEITQAQVPPITPTAGAGNLGTVVTQNGNTYNITGGTRPEGGLNLFQSFGEFGVPTNNIANFLNETALPTNNILCRVTGGNPSNIFGTIQTEGFTNTNLFLMNPAGFLFGPNATVNVGGMAHFTTADYLRLTDGVRFEALPGAQDALLSTASVAAFGFLGSDPAAITVQGSQITMANGTGLSLIGGNRGFTYTDPDTHTTASVPDGVTITEARLSAPIGQITLASVASPGEILYPSLQFAPNINGLSFTNMGAITLAEGSLLNVSADTAGTIRIRSSQFVIDNATISADTINANGAPVAIDINLTGDLLISTAAVPALTARTTGSGDAGEIRISSQNMDVTATGFGDFTPFSVIDTHTSASGEAGAVSITTTNDLTVTGDPADFVVALDSGTTGPDGGQGGNVTLNAKNIDIQYAQISTGDFVATNLGEEAVGSGGNLMITSDSLKLTNSFMVVDGSLGGSGGILTILTRDAQLGVGSALSASGFVKGGAIRINADRLMVDNTQFEVSTALEPAEGINITGRVLEFKNGSTITAQTFGDATAGRISITATDHFTLSDDPANFDAQVRPTGLFTNSLGIFGTLGDSGPMIVITPRLEIFGGARFDSATRTSGSGGSITINADVISIAGERPVTPFPETQFFLGGGRASGIYTRTTGSRFCTGPCGDAGATFITTGILDLVSGGQINGGTTTTGRGGTATINAMSQINISGTMSDGTPSGIFSLTTGMTPDAGRGGDINATAGHSITISNIASISANSIGPGNAGNISINAGQQFEMRESSITAKATQASGGNIDIQAVDRVRLVNSEISSSVQGGASTAGGNITIDPNVIVMQNSDVTAKAVQGAGGNITLTTPLFLADSSSQVSASSDFGVNGTVTIQSPTSNLSESLGTLPSEPSQAHSLLTQRCAALVNGQASSFVVVGREQLPADPGGWLTSPLAFAALGESLGAGHAVASAPAVMAIATHDTGTVSLRRLTPAGFLVANFADSEATGCHS